ncbi:hypothetical protein [Gaoshiqia sediminis]|uniref:Response regulatory domain-containing protein n=1 Tax=Gaoshiqia sediminis TaxID=2986998 RepID=A0AA41YBY6_9BACT|nr:hypothetical protein [Gaoshiqia sediminis]MCW0483355.1 hypothetical protein [Gaoshiqia sediminis]
MKLKGPYRVELLVRDTATGFLMADSVPGERSLFRITLPTQNSSEDKKPMSLFLGEGDFSCLHGKTVLVVDDNPFIHEIVSLHVQDFEIRILKAANGQGVFHLVRNQAPYLNYR